MHLLEQLRAQLARLAPAPGGMVVAVSGGADSIALLRSLHFISGESMPLAVAHLNHALRGDESDADESFVRDLCAALKVPYYSRKIDVAAFAKAAGDNLEAAARRLRYDWFAELAVELGMKYVATGHTADDQAETVLLRLLRGAGLQGLRGIAPSRSLDDGVTLIRPLLTCSRAEIRTFLQEIDQRFREDRSNVDVRLTRNRIRREVLPRLAQESPGITAHLAQLAEQAAEAFAVIEADAQQLLSAAELHSAGRLRVLRCENLAAASAYLVCEALRVLWTRERWPTQDMRRADWERAAAVARTEAPAVDLPGPIRVQSTGRVVQIGPASAFV